MHYGLPDPSRPGRQTCSMQLGTHVQMRRKFPVAGGDDRPNCPFQHGKWQAPWGKTGVQALAQCAYAWSWSWLTDAVAENPANQPSSPWEMEDWLGTDHKRAMPD
jgi:hypothetical protein